MATHKQTRDSVNNARHTADTDMPDLSTMLEGFSLQGAMIKVAIGYAYAVVGFIASWNIAVMCALVTNIVFFQYVILFAVFSACLAALVYTTPIVTNAVYDGTLFAARKVGALFGKAKDMFNRPTEATVH